jgi:hypothetical protein
MLRKIIPAAFFALVALPMAASAQTAAPAKLTAGTWTGTIITPGNNDPTDLSYVVEYKADALAITLVAGANGEHGRFPLNDIKVSTSEITFSFTPGPKVLCDLKSKDAGYEGNCKDDDGNVVPLTMLPPAKKPNS